MFADVMNGSTWSSAPMRYAPKLSPMSQFRSTRIMDASRVLERDRASRLLDLMLACKVQRVRIVERDWPKCYLIARFELGEQRKVDRRNFADARIATRRLSVGHEDDRLAIWRELHRAEKRGLRQQLQGRREGERR